MNGDKQQGGDGRPMCACGRGPVDLEPNCCVACQRDVVMAGGRRPSTAQPWRFVELILPKMREVARDLGYAIAIHGSLTRDIDLVAVPWVEGAVSATKLAQAVRESVDGTLRAQYTQPEARAHGRLAWSFDVPGLGDAYVDLSVIPLGQHLDEARPHGWYSFDPADGYTEHDTSEMARDVAQEHLDGYREEARSEGEWDIGVGSIHWGRMDVRGDVQEVRQDDDHVDYVLVDATGAVTDATHEATDQLLAVYLVDEQGRLRFVRRTEVTVDVGRKPDPPLTDVEMQRVVHAAKMAYAGVLRERAEAGPRCDDAIERCAQLLEARAAKQLAAPKRRGASERDRRLRAEAIREAAAWLRKHARKLDPP